MTTTPNYGFTLPAIGGDQNVWGGELNGNWMALDGIIHSLVIAAGGAGAGYMPLTGGTINGNFGVTGVSTLSNVSVGQNLTVSGSQSIQGNLVVLGSMSINTVATGTLELGSPAVSDWLAYRSAPDRVFQWQSGCTDVWHETTAVRYWNNNRFVMSLDFNGNLVIIGNASMPGGGPWSASSDDRVKQNARPYGAGLNEIRRLEPIAFEYNGQGGTEADGVTYHGVSAQRARAIMPELVFEQRLGTRDGSLDPKLLPGQLATNLGPLTLALCNAVRELADWLETVEARLA